MKKKVAVVTLGCPKNLVDSEIMAGFLMKDYTYVEDPADAEVIVVNTCTFIQASKEESLETIFEMAALKETGSCRTLLATGCLVQEHAQALMREIPELDGVLGTGKIAEIGKLARTCGGTRTVLLDEGTPNFLQEASMPRKRFTPAYSAYVKIAEGCDNYCSYCVIPYVRGRFRSRSEESVLCEVREMAAQGVKEILIMAQDTTRYGEDLGGELRLPQLIRQLAKIEGIEWIRLLYCYPDRFTDELIETMRREPKVCRYVDLPLQHADNKVLKEMNRRGPVEDAEILIGKLRAAMPDIRIRTTMITGFPGESEQDFQTMIAFIKRVKFDRLGVFAYSQEENTVAGQREDQVLPEVREQRRDMIMQLQQGIALAGQQRWVGQTLKVLVEQKLPDGGWIGRTEGDAPEIDGQVYIRSTRIPLQEGRFVQIRILEADSYDLSGEVVL